MEMSLLAWNSAFVLMRPIRCVARRFLLSLIPCLKSIDQETSPVLTGIGG